MAKKKYYLEKNGTFIRTKVPFALGAGSKLSNSFYEWL
jgi:hypothetical protein